MSPDLVIDVSEKCPVPVSPSHPPPGSSPVPPQSGVEPCGLGKTIITEDLTIEKPCAPVGGECPPSHVLDEDGTLCWRKESQPSDCKQLGTCPNPASKPVYDWNEQDRKQCAVNRGGFYAVACGFLDKQPINPAAQKWSAGCAVIGVYRVAECETDYPPDLHPEPKPPRPWWSIFW
jgi:hypothetical protein